MTESGLKEDWLFTNALVAFVGALLMAQTWDPSEGTFKFQFFFEIPNYVGFTVFLIIAAIFIFSIVLAIASVIPRFRNPMLRFGNLFAIPLDAIVWTAFIISLLTSIPELPLEQWWVKVLLAGGVVFFFLIPVKMYMRLFRYRS